MESQSDASGLVKVTDLNTALWSIDSRRRPDNDLAADRRLRNIGIDRECTGTHISQVSG